MKEHGKSLAEFSKPSHSLFYVAQKLRTVLLFFFSNFTRIYLTYKVVLISSYRKVNQIDRYRYTHTSPFLSRLFSHIGNNTILSKFLCALGQVLVTHLFYTQQCIHINPNLLIDPFPLHISPLINISLVSKYLSLFLSFIVSFLLDNTYQ